LNPHSGESGHLGSEDSAVIAPAIADAVAAGIDARGPIPADTLFVPERLKGADAVLAMYHDQGLPVLKYASFGRGVNVTSGCPSCAPRSTMAPRSTSPARAKRMRRASSRR